MTCPTNFTLGPNSSTNISIFFLLSLYLNSTAIKMLNFNFYHAKRQTSNGDIFKGRQNEKKCSNARLVDIRVFHKYAIRKWFNNYLILRLVEKSLKIV